MFNDHSGHFMSIVQMIHDGKTDVGVMLAEYFEQSFTGAVAMFLADQFAKSDEVPVEAVENAYQFGFIVQHIAPTFSEKQDRGAARSAPVLMYDRSD